MPAVSEIMPHYSIGLNPIVPGTLGRIEAAYVAGSLLNEFRFRAVQALLRWDEACFMAADQAISALLWVARASVAPTDRDAIEEIIRASGQQWKSYFGSERHSESLCDCVDELPQVAIRRRG
jgi:hypothetical protein